MKKVVLVTGGAGYIGSVAVKSLIEKDYDVVVVDNLSKGIRALVDKKAQFFEADLCDKEKLEEVFRARKIDSVIHFAGYKAAEESMENPSKYSDNIKGTVNLLDLMVKYKIRRIIYSSSAAVYGTPEYVPVDENHPTNPLNYYGVTKLVCEQLIGWYSLIHDMIYVSLRYFNVAGDGGLSYTDPYARNVLPIIMEVIFGKRESFIVFGEDYGTRDGTCIRDYIDVNDLVRAHISALDADKSDIINLGTSKGVSVQELVDYTKEITGEKFSIGIGERRKGDSPELVASNEKASQMLGWKPEVDIKEMIISTYGAYRKNFV